MKVLNRNSSSIKTRKLIKSTFIQMLSEKKEIRKISVIELVKRADISRATFYAHFDDIYGVVEEFENELIDKFFTHAKLLATDNYEQFFETLFAFMKENNDNYGMMCKTNEFLFSATRLSALVIDKLTELCNEDGEIKNREFLELEISVFVEGRVCEYVKYCRGISTVNLDELHSFALARYENFIKTRRSVSQ